MLGNGNDQGSLEIDPEQIGGLVGKGGSTVRQIEADTGASVQVVVVMDACMCVCINRKGTR